MGERAVVLLSGGLDSTTVLHVAADEGLDVYALTFRYGQRHLFELEAARRQAALAGVREHLTIGIDPVLFGGSSLTGHGEVPLDGEPGKAGGIPSTYVPARNTVFLAMALAGAESVDAGQVFIGVNSVDFSGYPDCRPEYMEAFQSLADIATRRGVEGTPVKVRAPLLRMTKAEIIRLGTDLGVDYSMTASCYRPDGAGRACGRCDACTLRLRGFREAGLKDPAVYSRGSGG